MRWRGYRQRKKVCCKIRRSELLEKDYQATHYLLFIGFITRTCGIEIIVRLDVFRKINYLASF
jgi:hypothetical protein